MTDAENMIAHLRLEQRIDRLESLIKSHTDITNAYVTLLLQKDGLLSRKVADDLRLLQLNLPASVAPELIAQIAGLRSLLSATESGECTDSQFVTTLRLVDPPMSDS